MSIIPYTYQHHRTKLYPNYTKWGVIGLGGLVVASWSQQPAEAKGYRGNGFRPYDCRWRSEFIKQAEEALRKAEDFEEHYKGKDYKDMNDKDKQEFQKTGTTILVALLWAQDQGEHLINKHYDGYFCWVARSSVCDQYKANLKSRDYYHHRLEKKIQSLRRLMGVPQPAGWEEQVGHFLLGGAKAGLLIVSTQAVMAAIPGLNLVAIPVFGVHLLYKGCQYIDKNVFNPKKGLAEEETAIQQELFVRALCADEASIRQAQAWGGFVVTAYFVVDGLADMALNVMEAAEAAEVLEVAEAAEVLEVAEVAEAAEVVEVVEVAEAAEVVEVAEVAETAEVIEAPEVAETAEVVEAAEAAGVPKTGKVNGASKITNLAKIRALRKERLCNEGFWKTLQLGFRKFTLKNARENLKILWKAAKMRKINFDSHHAHHVIPKEFAQRCKALDINVHDPRFMTFLRKEAHMKLHGPGRYNQVWDTFFKDKNRSKEEVINFMLDIIEKHGFEMPVFFI